MQWVLPPNMMRFLYADGFLPVGHVKARLVALGKQSTDGVRPAVAGATLDWDVVMSDAGFFTRSGGEIELNDPRLLQAYDYMKQEIKRTHPALSHWDGVPGQPTPQFGGMVNPQLASDRLYPNVPLTVELLDDDMAPPVLSLPMKAGTVVTSWQRPPLATFDQNDFFDPAEFLQYLALRYDFLSNMKVPDLSIRLICSNASAVDLGFFMLQKQVVPGNGRWMEKTFRRVEEDSIVTRVGRILSHNLRIPMAPGQTGVYLAALRALAGYSSLNPLAGPPEKLLDAILDVLGTGPDIVRRSTSAEDWAALGILVFYIGAISFGYRWGSFNRAWNNGWWQIDATARLKP